MEKRISALMPLVAIIAISSIAWLDPYRDAVSSGNEEFNKKNYNNAKRYYEKAERYAPAENDKKKLSFNTGDADYMLESYDSALSGYQQAIQSDDRDVQKKAFFNSGNAYLKQKNYREAIIQLALTTLRSVLGQSELDELLAHRDQINLRLRQIKK